MLMRVNPRIVKPSAIARAKAQKASKQHPIPESLAAPIGGWNARDALGNMDPLDAVFMTNWYPIYNLRPVAPRLLEPCHWAPRSSAKLISIQAARLISYVRRFDHCKIYDVTTAGAVGAAAVNGLTNAQFQHVNVTTTAGSFIMAVNGADVLQYFDGTTWSADGGTYTITGVTTSTIAGINLFKNRVWLIPDGDAQGVVSADERHSGALRHRSIFPPSQGAAGT
jgi:hypothetical protein